MNPDAEKIQLIDISSEDDFLIDSHFDNNFIDFRLSVALETQNELVCNPKSRIRAGTKDRVPSFAENEREAFRLEREYGETECSIRKSLAWDHAFFTSPGFLELEELSLVNRGFKNLEVSNSYGIKENIKSKVCQERNLSHKLHVGARNRRNCQSSLQAKVASPSNMMSMKDSKRQQMATVRSEEFSGMVTKPHFLKSTSSRKEFLKSSGIMSQSRVVPTMHIKKPPLRAISRNGLGIEVSQQPDSWTSKSVATSQSLLSSLTTNNSVHLSPYKTSTANLQTAGLSKAQEMEGETYLSNSSGSQNSGIKAKRSPLSSKTSSLRMPSQKIGFFDDMKSKTDKHDQDSIIKHSHSGQRRRSNQGSLKKQTKCLEFEEKENVFHHEDTVIELDLKKSSPSPSQLVPSGSSVTRVQYSSSSKNHLTKPQHSTRQTLLSPNPRTRTLSSTKVSPLKRSAFF